MPSTISSPRLREKLQNLFEAAQEQSGHQGLAEKCKKLYSKCGDPDVFLKEFVQILRYCLCYQDKQAVDRMLSFVAKFVIVLYSSAKLVDGEDDSSEVDDINDIDPVATGIVHFLFKNNGADSMDARLRIVQLLNKILSGMPEHSTISDEMWQQLSEVVLSRIQDKSPLVRAQSVLTARKLQDPKNGDCEIIKALTFHLNDPSSAVRRCVVSSIALNKTTIVYILGRTRDVNDNVRRNAYIVFSKVKVLNLSLKYRITILERGLQDRAELVRDCVQKILVVNWLENCNRNIIEFLETLDVINNSDVAISVVESIIKTQPLEDVLKCLPIDEDKKLIPVDKLTPESVLLWRCLAHHFSKEDKDDELDAVIPNLTIFCEYIRSYYQLDKPVGADLSQEEQWTEITQGEILLHLLQLAKVFDLSDEMGRSNLKKLITDMLICSRISNNISDCLIELMVPVIPGSDAFLQEVTEIISEVREPLTQVVTELPGHKKIEHELKMFDVKVNLNELREREYAAVNNKDYVKANELKEEIEKLTNQLNELQSQPAATSHEVREEKNDPVTLCKCLSILLQMVKCSGVRALTPTLRSLKENFLDLCLQSNDLLTQSLAIQALAQYCILDKELAKENLFKFVLMISENGDTEVTVPALKAVFDIIHVYGIESFEIMEDSRIEDAESSKTRTKTLLLDDGEFLNETADLETSRTGARCVSILKELLNCKTNDSLRTVAFEGLCKLLLSGVVYSSSLLTKVILMGFSPIVESEAEDFIRQVFMVFFPIFASKTPRSQEMIESAFLPTLNKVSFAKLGTPEADISPKNVADFLIDNTKPDTNPETAKTLHVHNDLALALCHEIIKNAENLYEFNLLSVYLKALLQLEISDDSESFLLQLRTLKERLEEKLQNIPMASRYGVGALLKDFGKKIDQKVQGSVQSVENTLATTDNETRTTRRTSVTDTTVNSVATCRTSNGSSSATAGRSTKKRRVTQDTKLTIVSESPENTHISESSESTFSTPANGNKEGRIVPESPELSD